MKRVIVVILLSFLFCFKSFAQGFDWQYSARLPFDVPFLFIGLNTSSEINTISGKFPFIEKEVKCTDFNDGDGFSWSLGLSSQYWIDALSAISLDLKYKFSSVSFKSNWELPRVDYTVRYQNEYSSNIDIINMSISYKKRIYNSHFAYGAGIDLDFILSNEAEHWEKILGPSDEPPYPGNPPSYKRKISDASIEDLNSLIVTPNLKFSYDLDLGLSTYSEIGFKYTPPIFNYLIDGRWRQSNYSFYINILRGIN